MINQKKGKGRGHGLLDSGLVAQHEVANVGAAPRSHIFITNC